MNVNNFLKNYKQKFNSSTNFVMNIRRVGNNTHSVSVKNKLGKNAASLKFRVTPLQMYIIGGRTFAPYDRRGIGIILRALATKAGKIAKSNHGRQEGVFENRSRQGPNNIPNSSKIMKRLGWRVNEINGNFVAKFNYNKNNISAVNRILNERHIRNRIKKSAS